MTVRAFVNERAVDVPMAGSVLDAVRAFDPSLLSRLESGSAYVTDGRGIELPLDARLEAGAILRVVVSARGTAARPDADA